MQRPEGSLRSLVVDLVLVTVIATVAVTIAYQLWTVHPRVPFGYGGDGLWFSHDAKTIVETGWVQSTSRLGAPFGQTLYDFPISGDNGNFVIMRLIAEFTDDWALVLNGFLILSFFTASWVGYLVLRWLRCGRTSSIVCALLFAFAPYHLGRGAGHLLLSSYFVVPIGVLLAVRASTGRSLVARHSSDVVSSRRRRMFLAVRSAVPWVLLCVICGSFGSYYFFFSLITMAMAAAVMAASYRTIRPIIASVPYAAAIGATFVANVSPNLLYRAAHGTNPIVARRSPIELDLYGLRLIQMLSPVPGHWFGPLRSVSADLRKGYGSEGSSYFGIVAAVALVLMLGWLAGVVVRPKRSEHDVRSLLAFLTLAWILIATTGGLDWFLTLIGFTQIRAWNRVSILLMFVSLAWLAMTIAPAIRRWSASRARRRATGALAGIVLVFGLVDQCSADFIPGPNVYDSSFASDRAFFTSVEQRMPAAAMVYQLPYRRFPEEVPLYGSGDYDLYRPYLQTEKLRWSYGGMKGREAEWQAQLANLSAAELTRDVVAVGFQAYVIDRAGFADHGAQLEQDIFTATGRSSEQSSDGRWAFFDLTGLASQLGTPTELAAVRHDLLNSPRLSIEGCSGLEGSGSDAFHWCGRSGTVQVVDPEPDGRPNLVTASVVGPAGAGTLHLTVAGVTTDVAIGPTPVPISVPAPAGSKVAIAFTTDVPPLAAAGDPRDLRFRLIFAQVKTA